MGLGIYLHLVGIDPTLPAFLASNFNIYNFTRYSVQQLIDLKTQAEEKDKPYILKVTASQDHNGALSQSGVGIRLLKNQLGDDGNVLFMEAASAWDIVKCIQNRIKNGHQPPQIIYIFAHGNTGQIHFSDEVNGSLTKSKLEHYRIKGLLNYLEKTKTKVVLQACSTGKGNNSIGQSIANQGVKIIAPQSDINGTESNVGIQDGQIAIMNLMYQNYDDVKKATYITPTAYTQD